MLHRVDARGNSGSVLLYGGRCAIAGDETILANLELAGGRVARIRHPREAEPAPSPAGLKINLRGLLVLPGLINAHDHLQFALFPRLGNPPYRNYIEWGEDIHATLSGTINQQKAVPKAVRLWWGGIRNLLCGVTTVCHHDALWPELLDEEFPVRVVRRYGWAHSAALGGDLRKARAAVPDGAPFLVHACEGIDDLARDEIFTLDRMGVLDAATVLVHGLALDREGIALLKKSQSSLIVCPSSNEYLFGRLPEMDRLGSVKRLALGNDSPLTAVGDLLDEVRFSIERCGIAPLRAYRMLTAGAAAVLRLRTAGVLRDSTPADLIAVRDTGVDAAERMKTLSIRDVQLVMIGGKVQLAAEPIWKQLPAAVRAGMEPLWIAGMTRWLRAPVAELLRQAEVVLGRHLVKLGGRPITCADATWKGVPEELPTAQGVRS